MDEFGLSETHGLAVARVVLDPLKIDAPEEPAGGIP